MKKIIASLLTIVIMLGAFTACSNSNRNTFPQYDWVHKILGDHVESLNLTLLLDSGVDLHNYQPSTDDIVTLSTCDMFIYVGGESDEWVENALKKATTPNMIVVNLLDVLGDAVKEEEAVEGMEAEEEDHDEEEGAEYDEHVWLSLKNAQTICAYIADKLVDMDADNAGVYTANANSYIQQLASLNAEYQAAVDEASYKTLLFGDRFPLRYLVDDYGLDYYAAFAGCSAETEASFETVVFLSEKVNELGLKNVIVLEDSDQKIAHTIIQNTADKDQTILVLDSMQSITASDIADGATYLSIMQENLEVLKAALQ